MNVYWPGFSIGIVFTLFGIVAVVSKWTPWYGGWVTLVLALSLVIDTGMPIWDAFVRWIKRRFKHQ